jgi:hypothetical protein
MGERGAVDLKSGESVRQSDPGLRRPTTPLTAGRKPAARPYPLENREAVLPQRKTGRGAGQSPAMFAEPTQLEDGDIAKLAAFFRLLDSWERNLYAEKVM